MDDNGDDDDDDDDDDVMVTIAIAAMKPRLTWQTVRPLCALAPSDGFVIYSSSRIARDVGVKMKMMRDHPP